MRRGTFLVFEGIDGSGKSTQIKLLEQRIKRLGRKVKTMDFPQYGKKSAGMVEEYLAGKYGNAHEVGPYITSIFYAVDRYDVAFAIRKWLKQGFVVISDRYLGSNIGHQGGKIKNQEERKKYFDWLLNLEYNIFNIPKPDKMFLLNLPAKTAQILCNNQERRKKKKQDIHEKSLHHLKEAAIAYLHAASLYPKDFMVIEEMEGKRLLRPHEVHEKVWKSVKNLV